MGQIAIALSSRNMDALPSSTKTPATISRIKNLETCKVIKLRSGKEYEGSTSTRNEVPTEELSAQDRSRKEKTDLSKELV